MFHIERVRRDEFGNISHIRLDSGDVLNYLQAFELARRGEIEGVVDGADDLGRPTIKSADYTEFEDNLIFMPHF
jgi:hypothetical protein